MALLQFVFGLAAAIIFTSKSSHASSVCGTVNGSDASPGNWPWQATIISNTSYGTFFYCGGTLINDQWVLGSANCLHSQSPETLVVYLGSTTSKYYLDSTVFRNVAAVYYHPSYDYYSNDICLLKLSAPVTFTSTVRPVCLAEHSSTFYTGVSSMVAGWGLYDEPMYYEKIASFVGEKECSCRRAIFIPRNSICAEIGNNTNTQGPGLPLLVQKDSVWVQSGVLTGGCYETEPCVFTDVSKYQDWISYLASTPEFVNFTSPGADSDVDYNCTTYVDDIFASGSDKMTPYFSQLLLLCALTLILHVMG